MIVPAGRAISGYLAATALASAFMAVSYVILEHSGTTQATVFVSRSHVIDDMILVSVVFFAGWVVSTIISYIPFLVLFWLGRLLTLWSLPYALITGVISAEFAVWSTMFALARGQTGLLNERQIAVQLNGLAIVAGLVGGLLFWWIADRKTLVGERKRK